LEEAAHVVHHGVFDVRNLLADGVPLVRVLLVSQGLHFQPNVAVGLVEVALLELLHHYFALHVEAIFGEGQVEHPVAFKPETSFDVGGRQREVIIGDVAAGEGVVFATHPLQGLVVAGDVDGA
jgi:hypothetical protein